MFRSEFAAQRIVAMRMLSGILLRRECAVSLEAYSPAFAHNVGVKGEHSELGGVEDEVGRESCIFTNLSVCFEALVASVTSTLSTSASGNDLVLAGSSSAAVPAVVSCEHRRQLRKLLCWSCMHLLCAPDLPVELPMLLLWALGSNISMASLGDAGAGAGDLQLAPSFGLNAPRNNPAVAKLSLLRCLHMYLRSPAEEASVDWLRCSSSLWAAYGTPRLSTPHTRRPGGSSYEQDMAECLERSSKFLAEEEEDEDDDGQQNEQKPRTPDSVAEAFALQCRWSRVSAIVGRSAVVASLANHAITAVENLVDAAASNASSSSGEIVTALGISSLQLLALIARQGGDDILPVLHRQFLRPSWRFFVAMCESGYAGADAALGEICRRWWNVLVELVLRDRTAAAFLFETQGEWMGTIVLRLLVRKPSAPAAASSENGNPAETIGSVVGRVLQSCLAYGFGFECVTELLMADQVSSAAEAPSSEARFSVRLLLVLEQAAVSAGAVLGAYVSGLVATSHVPFALPKAVSEAIQASSSIFSFLKRNWVELQRIVLVRSLSVECSTATVALLSAVFARAQNDQLAAVSSELSGEMVSVCRAEMAASIAASGGLRGRGLIFAAISFNAHLLAEEQQKVGGSVTAAVLHLSGQGRDLARFAAAQDLFDLTRVAQCIADYAASSSSKCGPVIGSTAWLQSQEHALALYRHLNVAAEMGGGGSGSLGHSEALQVYTESARLCCQMLRILRLPLAGGEDVIASVEEHLIKGSVAEGILVWHGQRVQQAGIVVQITGIASFLVRHPRDELTAGSLDWILAAQLPKVTANSHCAFLVGFTRMYLRRLVFACHSSERTHSSELYGELETNYGAFADAVANKAFRCDVSFVRDGEVGAVCGTAPYTRAGEWMTLRGPGNTAIALKASWAFDVLMGELAGEHLADWLQVLLFQHQLHSQSGGSDESLLASQIYTLLKLSAPDQALKWTCASQAELAGKAIGEVNERAVLTYRLLLTQLLQVAGSYTSTFTAAFCRVVSKEYFATTGVMSSHRHKMRAARNGPSKYVNLEGVLDLCEKALEAGLNQAIDERVHSIVLIALSGPLVPWSVRQRVWTQLSALRLVHLLEDRTALLALLPLFLQQPGGGEVRGPAVLRGPMATESLSLYLEIVDALCNLRSAADRTWTIVSVSIVQLSRFIFCETSVTRGHRTVNDVISGQRAELLMHILSLKEEKGLDVMWLCKALIAQAAATYADSCGERSSPLENVVGKVCTAGGEDTGTEIARGIAALPQGLVVDKGDGIRTELSALIHV